MFNLQMISGAAGVGAEAVVFLGLGSNVEVLPSNESYQRA